MRAHLWRGLVAKGRRLPRIYYGWGVSSLCEQAAQAKRTHDAPEDASPPAHDVSAHDVWAHDVSAEVFHESDAEWQSDFEWATNAECLIE